MFGNTGYRECASHRLRPRRTEEDRLRDLQRAVRDVERWREGLSQAEQLRLAEEAQRMDREVGRVIDGINSELGIDTEDDVVYDDSRKVVETEGESEMPETRPVFGPGSIAADKRKFGVEIEVNLPNSGSRWYEQPDEDRLIRALRDRGVEVNNSIHTHNGHSNEFWTLKRDGSLNARGVELVSYPMKGKAGMKQLELACAALKDAGARPTPLCGIHIHHEVTDLSLRAFKNVIALYARHQQALDLYFTKKRRSTANYTYAMPLPSAMIGDIMRLRSLNDLGSYTRYRVVNTNAYPRYGTLEFRQHQSSIKFTEIGQWVRLGQALIRKAKNEDEVVDPYIGSPQRGVELLEELGIDHHRGLKSRTEWLMRRQAAGSW